MSNRADNREDRPRDDHELVRACQKGDVDAFEILVKRYEKRMFNTAYRMTSDYEEAADVVQDGFLAAYRAIGKFRGDASFSTWLTAIIVNHARNRLKQMRTHQRHEGVSIDDPVETPDGPVPFQPASSEASAEERLQRKEVQEKVQECVETLDEEYRAVLVLRDIQGFSYDEIRDILKIPDGTVKSRLFRARDAMRHCLKGKLGDL
jgi:RNA polymerase sigma-70 factor (ECF subfamily)